MYRIKSSIIKTCMIQILMVFWSVIMIIILLISLEYDPDAKYKLVVAIVVFGIICISAIYNYIKVGEGIFEDGVIYRGVFRSWEICKGYQIYPDDADNANITIYFEARSIDIQVESMDIERIDNILSKHCVKKIDLHQDH
ncbi:hypothetical protein [Vallitalea sediminicola]